MVQDLSGVLADNHLIGQEIPRFYGSQQKLVIEPSHFNPSHVISLRSILKLLPHLCLSVLNDTVM
jgi:hypothetical protein